MKLVLYLFVQEGAQTTAHTCGIQFLPYNFQCATFFIALYPFNASRYPWQLPPFSINPRDFMFLFIAPNLATKGLLFIDKYQDEIDMNILADNRAIPFKMTSITLVSYVPRTWGQFSKWHICLKRSH